MALDRKRTQHDYSSDGATSSSSARARYTASPRAPMNAEPYNPYRTESPPASAYFSHFDGDHHHEPHPTWPDTDAHFAYSTTLRRHTLEGPLGLPPPSLGELRNAAETEGPRGVWDRTRDQYELLPTSRKEDAPTESASARFAHYSIQVRHSGHSGQFGTSVTDGLSARRVSDLLATHGYNEFTVSTPEPMLIKFAKTIYENPLILLLCGSAVVSAVMGNIDDAVSITVAVLIVLTVGFVQEQRSEKSLEALNKLVPHHCHLIREGKPLHVLANELVPGDIVTFSTGDRVPADVRLVSALDGETTTRRKDTETCTPIQSNGYPNGNGNGYGAPTAEPVALADRSCIAYMGTLVRNGRGTGIVIATGTQTEFGMIFAMMQEVEEKRTPLQLSMDELATKLSMISFGIIGVICLIGVIQKRPWLDMFTIGVSLAVAAIPEGLPIVTTVTLALGVLRMSKRKAIVKKLHSVEALGSVSVICSDKTGTLTKNEQTVTEIYSVDETITLDGSASQTLIIGSGAFVGQSTDVALLNVNLQRPHAKRRDSVQLGTQGNVLHQGQVQVLLRLDESTPALEQHTPSYHCSGIWLWFRRDAFFHRPFFSHPQVQPRFRWVPSHARSSRKGVADAINLLQSGGVQVETALSIARALGLRVGTGAHSGCLTGQAIDRMTKEQLREMVGGVSVFARTTPKHKMAIVEAFQSRGAIVAMTGDGVNDAPALKMADIGVSMGKSGTDVAKEAADMILVDDNFSTILPAVEEGKSIFHNIQNFLSFQLSTACAALTLITLSTFFGLDNPLNAMQILFINILMDGPPSQSLGVDPVDPQVMRRPPRKKDAPVISKRLVYRVLFSASIIVVGTLFVYVYALADDQDMTRREQTMTFTCFVFLDLVSAVQNRGMGCGLFQNRMLVTTVSTSFLVQLALIYVSFLQSIFQTEALGLFDLCTLLALGAVSATLHEARRRYERSLNATMTYSSTVEELA
ncbi:calcium-transporting ATPase [Epithele typhae]|uniref:calcium-transporting ATPase n=1 Tax=Epithele typhae TaxID=378194 RepID=UPI002007590F|nr:calcium-transporting ATPase [Epithele typhae]KAH9935143.1 calcium-transporting ATPase [Epithele typhae]